MGLSIYVKKNQKVTIGEEISLRVLRLKGKEVKINIEAPEGLRIERQPLKEKSSFSNNPRIQGGEFGKPKRKNNHKKL